MAAKYLTVVWITREFLRILTLSGVYPGAVVDKQIGEPHDAGAQIEVLVPSMATLDECSALLRPAAAAFANHVGCWDRWGVLPMPDIADLVESARLTSERDGCSVRGLMNYRPELDAFHVTFAAIGTDTAGEAFRIASFGERALA